MSGSSRFFLCLFLVGAFCTGVFYLDRFLIGWQNQKIVQPERGFARWPTTRLSNPLVEERLSDWDRRGIDCYPGFCDERTHSWVMYVEWSGEVFISFHDYARLNPAHLKFKREQDGVWKECHDSWSSCDQPTSLLPYEKYVEHAVEVGHYKLHQ